MEKDRGLQSSGRVDSLPLLLSSTIGVTCVGVSDTHVFLLNEYIVELNSANFNILNQILN